MSNQALNDRFMLAQFALNHCDFGYGVSIDGFDEGWDWSDSRSLSAVLDMSSERHPEDRRGGSFRSRITVRFDLEGRIDDVEVRAGHIKRGSHYVRPEQWDYPIGHVELESWYDPLTGDLKGELWALPQNWKKWDPEMIWAHLYHAARHGNLPPDFDRWGDEGPIETPLAHVAAINGNLPPDFDLDRWGGLLDADGVSLKEVIARQNLDHLERLVNARLSGMALPEGDPMSAVVREAFAAWGAETDPATLSPEVNDALNLIDMISDPRNSDTLDPLPGPPRSSGPGWA